MPLVQVRHPSGMYGSRLFDLGTILAHIVATTLSAEEPDSHLTDDDIEVTFDEKKPYDRVKHDLLVNIEAYDYPSRFGNRQQRCDQIRDEIKKVYQGSVGIWLKILEGAAWAEAPVTT